MRRRRDIGDSSRVGSPTCPSVGRGPAAPQRPEVALRSTMVDAAISAARENPGVARSTTWIPSARELRMGTVGVADVAPAVVRVTEVLLGLVDRVLEAVEQRHPPLALGAALGDLH